MVKSQTNGCLASEVLAAYVDQGLSLAERTRVDAHLASCPRCIAMVAGVVRTVEAVSEFMPVGDVAVEACPRVDRRTLVGVLAAAAAVLVVLALPSMLRPWLDRDTGLVSLADSLANERSVLGRLTGGFPHAPLGGPSAGGQGGRAAEADRIVLTAGKIRESFGERDTPSRLHALGVQQLLAGRYDDAAQSLLAAAREQPHNARYLSDVAAVQLERARLGLRPDDLPRALAAADRARRLDPTLREAWFNRALAATALSLTEQAKQAWTEYLARDSVSAWAGEARKRLEELSKPNPAAAWATIEQRLQGGITSALADEAVRAQMTEARNFVDNDLLPKWAAAVEAGRDASRELHGLRNLADAFARIAGDSLYRDTVAVIDRAEARGANARLRLAAAHRRYAEAAAVLTEDRFADAAVLLEPARAELEATSSPFAHRAALDLATVAYYRGRAEEATRRLEAMHATIRDSGYASITARINWHQGLIAFGQGRLGDTEARYEEALAEYVRIGDSEQIAAVHNLLANLYGYLGDEALAWKHREAALPILNISRSPRLHHVILVGAANAIRRQDAGTALVFQDAVLEAATRWGRPVAIAEALNQRCEILLMLGRNQEASQALTGAHRAVDQIADSALRQRVKVAVLASSSTLVRSSSPEAAVRAATEALQLVDERQDRRRIAQLSLRLAKANIVWGRLEDAHVALARGMQAFESERASLNDEGRLSTLDESWELFDTAVLLAIKSKDYERAFALSERARARTLAEVRRAPGRSLKDVERLVADDQAIVALNQFDDGLAVWVIRRHGTTVTTRPVTRHDAARLVARQQAEIFYEARRPEASAELYNEILRPVASALRGASRLVVVPDSAYESTAFAALWDATKRHFLVEDVSLSLAPSVLAYASASIDPRVTTDHGGRPLIVGGLDKVAQDGALAVAAVYDSPELLTGVVATRSRLFADLAKHDIVHLAAHTASNQAYPFLSRVLLSDEPGQRHSGAVLGRDIAAQPMSRTRLVVVDEIEATGSNRREGTLSLARAFRAAGVPAVLGTLPGANETDSRDLMVGFHRRMASRMTAAEALTDLQRNVLQNNGRRLGAWSALVLYGSDR